MKALIEVTKQRGKVSNIIVVKNTIVDNREKEVVHADVTIMVQSLVGITQIMRCCCPNKYGKL